MDNHKMLGLREQFKKICERKGIKPYSLAIKGINRNTIDSLMRGSDIAVSSAHEIAKALDITIEELLTGEHSQHRENTREYYTKDEQDVINQVIDIIRGRNRTGASTLRETVKAFHKVKDFEVLNDEEDVEETKMRRKQTG